MSYHRFSLAPVSYHRFIYTYMCDIIALFIPACVISSLYIHLHMSYHRFIYTCMCHIIALPLYLHVSYHRLEVVRTCKNGSTPSRGYRGGTLYPSRSCTARTQDDTTYVRAYPIFSKNRWLMRPRLSLLCWSTYLTIQRTLPFLSPHLIGEANPTRADHGTWVFK